MKMNASSAVGRQELHQKSPLRKPWFVVPGAYEGEKALRSHSAPGKQPMQRAPVLLPTQTLPPRHIPCSQEA